MPARLYVTCARNPAALDTVFYLGVVRHGPFSVNVRFRKVVIAGLCSCPSLLQESPQKNYRIGRIVDQAFPAYSLDMKVALNFPTFRAGAGKR